MACRGTHCNLHGDKKIPNCSGHRAPQAEDATVNAASFLNSFGKGAKIDRGYIDNLRAKIAAEIVRRKQHSTYAPVNTTTLMSKLNLTINKGDKAVVDTQAAAQDGVMNALGGPGSPGRVNRGAPNAPDDDHTNFNQYPVGPNYTPPSTQEMDITTGSWQASPALSKGGIMYADQYTRLIRNYQRLYADCICHSDCNCNAVCNCHNNCGCDYSDMRLKMEIQYC